MLRKGLAASLSLAVLLGLGACAAPTVDENGHNIATASRVCDQELTGTHFKRCARDSTVESMSRDELEMARSRASNVTREPGQRLGR